MVPSTVYRNLAGFDRLGIVAGVHGRCEPSRYLLQHHPDSLGHLTCERCGAGTAVSQHALLEFVCTLPKASGSQINVSTVEITGLCDTSELRRNNAARGDVGLPSDGQR